MSATNAPFGLVPSFHPSGLDRAVALTDGIASTYNTAILKGQPVQLDTNGNLIIATTSSSLQGAFAGVQWTDTTGRVRISNNWPANTAYITGSCIAYYYSDPQIVYLIQADGPVSQTGLGDQANFSNIAAGSTTTGLSQCTANSSLVGAASTGQLKIVGLGNGLDNAWGDAYTVIQVQINKSQFQATVAAI
jgi:hypothetical protein